MPNVWCFPISLAMIRFVDEGRGPMYRIIVVLMVTLAACQAAIAVGKRTRPPEVEITGCVHQNIDACVVISAPFGPSYALSNGSVIPNKKKEVHVKGTVKPGSASTCFGVPVLTVNTWHYTGNACFAPFP